MTGLRKGDLQALRWEDVDLERNLVRVQRSLSRGEVTSPKSARPHAVPLPERVAEALARHRGESRVDGPQNLVFCHPATGGVYDGGGMLKRFKTALRTGGLRDARSHDLRHTFGTQMAAPGAPLRYIQEWMGHADYRTTSIYAADAADPPQVAEFARRAFPMSEKRVTQVPPELGTAAARRAALVTLGMLGVEVVTRSKSTAKVGGYSP
jgi:integrase